MAKLFNYLAARAKEPSTWAGAATLAVTLGHPGGAALIGTIGQLAALVFGTAAIVVPEKPAEKK